MTGSRIAFAVLLQMAVLALAWVLRSDSTTNTSCEDKSFRKIHDVEIAISSSNYARLEFQPREFVECGITLNGISGYSGTIRLKGNGSFQRIYEKPSLTCKIATHLVSTPAVGVAFLDKFYLNNCIQDHSLLQDVLARNIYRRCGIPVGEIAFASVKINGRNLGFYTIAEGVGKRLMKASFGDQNGTMIQAVCGEEVDSILWRSGHRPDAAVSEVFDKTNVMNLIVAECLMANDDGYVFGQNNYWVYAPNYGRSFKFMPHTADAAFRLPNFLSRRRVKGSIAQAFLSEESNRLGVLQILERQLDAESLTELAFLESSNLLCQVAARDPRITADLCRAVSVLQGQIHDHFLDVKTAVAIDSGQILYSESFRKIKNWQLKFGEKTALFDEGPNGVMNLICKSSNQDAILDSTLSMSPGAYELELPLRIQALGANSTTTKVVVSAFDTDERVDIRNSEWQLVKWKFNVPRSPPGQLFQSRFGRFFIRTSGFHGKISIRLADVRLQKDDSWRIQ